MKRLAVAIAFLFCAGVVLADTPSTSAPAGRPAPLLQELVRMTRAGASDAAVLAYARAHRLELPPELSDADLAWLRESGVSPRVVSYMSAVDVRASDVPSRQEAGGTLQESVPAGEAEQESTGIGPVDEYANGGSEPYPGTSVEASYGGYPDYGYPDSYGSYPFYGSYPWYDYGPYPYVFFAIANPFFFSDFHGHHHHHGDHGDHGDHGHHGHQPGSRHDGFQGREHGDVAHGGYHDAWRQRGTGQGRIASLVPSRGSARTVGPRGTSSYGYGRSWGRVAGRNGLGRAPARMVSPRGAQAPRSFSRPGGFGRPGFSSSPRGGSFRAAPRAIAPRSGMGSFGAPPRMTAAPRSGMGSFGSAPRAAAPRATMGSFGGRGRR